MVVSAVGGLEGCGCSRSGRHMGARPRILTLRLFRESRIAWVAVTVPEVWTRMLTTFSEG